MKKEQDQRFPIALIGECMVELQEVEPGCTQQTFGGDTLNTAVYMARLAQFVSLRVDYVTALGSDPFSDRMIKFWEAEGVGSTLVVRRPGEMPGLYYIQLDEAGERTFSYWRGEAAARRCFESLDSDRVLAELADYSCIYLSGISVAILTATSRQRLFNRLRELADSGVKIFFDYNYRPNLWGDIDAARSAYETLLPWCDTVFVGLDELGEIHGVRETRQGHKFLAQHGVGESVIRSGGGLCTISGDDDYYEVPAERVEQVVDTTAAGDSFSAAYVVGRLVGRGVVDSARMAHRMAAYVIGHKGAIAPVGEMPDFRNFLKA